MRCPARVIAFPVRSKPREKVRRVFAAFSLCLFTARVGASAPLHSTASLSNGLPKVINRLALKLASGPRDSNPTGTAEYTGCARYIDSLAIRRIKQHHPAGCRRELPPAAGTGLHGAGAERQLLHRPLNSPALHAMTAAREFAAVIAPLPWLRTVVNAAGTRVRNHASRVRTGAELGPRSVLRRPLNRIGA